MESKTLFQYFDCATKEELYQKIKNNEGKAERLLFFFEFMKKISPSKYLLRKPDELIDYLNKTGMAPKIGESLLINVNHTCEALKSARFTDQMPREIIKDSFMNGWRASFIISNDNTAHSKALENSLELLCINVFDNISLENKDKTLWRDSQEEELIGTLAEKAFRKSEQYLIHKHSLGSRNYDYDTLTGYREFVEYYIKRELDGKNTIYDEEKIKELLRIGYSDLGQEYVGLIAYDENYNINSSEVVFRGGLSASIFDIRCCIRNFAIDGGKGYVLFHNHPSGNMTPSADDFISTENMKKAAAVFNKEIMEHYIIGHEEVGMISDVDEILRQTKNQARGAVMDMKKGTKQVVEKLSEPDFEVLKIHRCLDEIEFEANEQIDILIEIEQDGGPSGVENNDIIAYYEDLIDYVQDCRRALNTGVELPDQPSLDTYDLMPIEELFKERREYRFIQEIQNYADKAPKGYAVEAVAPEKLKPVYGREW